MHWRLIYNHRNLLYILPIWVEHYVIIAALQCFSNRCEVVNLWGLGGVAKWLTYLSDMRMVRMQRC